MIVILKPKSSPAAVGELTENLEKQGVTVNPVYGTDLTILGLVGDTSRIDSSRVEANRIVERVMFVAEPFKMANKLFHPEPTVIEAGGRSIGANKIAVIAGPCSVETEEQIREIAGEVKAAGASFLRGGAFKPRTSPYAFQGLRHDGLRLLQIARRETGLPIVSEIMSPHDIDLFAESVDIIQVGARNMQNFDLLKELGRLDKPVLLKRGLSATIEEWLMSAEYLLAGGNGRVALCERGIRTFETYTRNTLDLSSVLAVKKMSHLPVVVDPSHAAGKWWMVAALARAAVAVGADGLMIEVHNDPVHALCDGQQSIKPDGFRALMDELRPIARAVGREL
ncbi:MAG: 3-deoxy-7-phosphoheptulonate synthase [Gracilibacteraceae bacterium]|nr:3-deoxy-7-phosphoheptulonate synthase [Gracilibacteraceae bacterium]